MPNNEYHVLSNYQYGDGGYVRMKGTEDWVTVAELGQGSYEWQEFKVFYSPSARRYFWHGDSGCSCNSWSDAVNTSEDFKNGDRDSVLRSWETFVKEHSYCFNVQEYQYGVSKIRAFREDAYEQ